MQSFSFVRALVATSVLCLALPLACGDSEENPAPHPNGGGEGGEPTTGGGGESATAGGTDIGGALTLPPGISDVPSTTACGSESCDSARVGIAALGQLYYIEPCCAGPSQDACGLDTTFLALSGASFEEICQAKHQPGDLDEACPATMPATIPFRTFMAPLSPFPGCCRPSGTCGVQVNEVVVRLGPQAVSIGNPELGCVDAAPFLPDADPVPCGDVPIGGSGAGGSGAGGASTPAGGSDGAGGAGAGN